MNSSSRVSLLALLVTIVFPRACYYAVIRAQPGCRTCGVHSEPRAITNNLYITGDLSACQNSSQNRLRPEQSARTDDNAAKRRRPPINRARFICRRRCRKDPPSGFSRGNRDILRRWKLLCPDPSFILALRFTLAVTVC